MAETPFSPEPGAPGAPEVPAEGGEEIPAAPAYSVEPAAVEPAVPEPVAFEPFVQPPGMAEGAAEAIPGGGTESAPPPPSEPAMAWGQPPIEPVAPEPPPAAPVEPPPSLAPADAGETPSIPFPSGFPAEPASSQAPTEPPGVAATIEVPPLETASAGEGGEWELLVARVAGWWNSGELGRQWQRIRGPLKGVAILVAVLLALRVYGTVVSTIDAIPLVSGLLELAGLITLLQFSATRLLRSSDRQEVLAQWRRRWQEFRGRD